RMRNPRRLLCFERTLMKEIPLSVFGRISLIAFLVAAMLDSSAAAEPRKKGTRRATTERLAEVVERKPDSTNGPIARIREEGMNHSKVMDTLGYLTEAIGPRLTGSANLKRAN